MLFLSILLISSSLEYFCAAKLPGETDRIKSCFLVVVCFNFFLMPSKYTLPNRDCVPSKAKLTIGPSKSKDFKSFSIISGTRPSLAVDNPIIRLPAGCVNFL